MLKRCPECGRDYYDDTLRFCLDDGTSLVICREEAATAILPGAQDAAAESVRGDRPLAGSDTPQNPGWRSTIAVATLVIAVLGGIIAYFYLSRSSAREIDSIAVLPFENASGDAELDYLSDGVSESVIDRLSQLPQLKVIARSSSFQYRSSSDPREVAEALGVAALITGRVIPRGDNVNIRVELIDARENKHLWGENFVRPMSDVQILQTDISRQIVETLRIRLSGRQVDQIADRGTRSPEAYELFLRGRFFFHKAGSPENFRRAAEYLERSIAVDPDFALAHAFLADAYGFGGFPPGMPRLERESLLERITRRAVDLDPQLAEAHNALATYMRRNWRWDEARASSLKAIELNPNLAQALNGYAFHLTMVGHHEEALEKSVRAREIDPISLVINTNLGNIYMRMRRYDEAIDILKKTINFGEPAMFARRSLGSVYMIQGMYDEAHAEYEEALRISGSSPSIKALIGLVHSKAGRRDIGEDIAREIKAESLPPPEFALLLDALGQRDGAFEVLELCLNNRAPGLPLVLTEPVFSPLSSDPRYRSLINRMGLSGPRNVRK